MDGNYMDHLEQVAKDDVEGLRKAQQSYGDSWKRRGGVGAFMMLARKWDRLENALKPNPHRPYRCHLVQMANDDAPPYDVFEAMRVDQRSEGIIDDIRDLRRYLMLVEAEARALGINPGHRDNDYMDKVDK